MHKLKFTLNQLGFGSVTLDGHPIDTARMTFTHEAGELNTVTLTIYAEVEGEIEVSELATVSRKPLSEAVAESCPQ